MGRNDPPGSGYTGPEPEVFVRLIRTLPALAASLLVACQGTRGDEPLSPDGTPPSCVDGDDFPEGAVEPMALGEVLFPYAWPKARSRFSGETVAMDLGDAPCAQSDGIEWSPFDVLLFVSIPAW